MATMMSIIPFAMWSGQTDGLAVLSIVWQSDQVLLSTDSATEWPRWYIWKPLVASACNLLNTPRCRLINHIDTHRSRKPITAGRNVTATHQIYLLCSSNIAWQTQNFLHAVKPSQCDLVCQHVGRMGILTQAQQPPTKLHSNNARQIQSSP